MDLLRLRQIIEELKANPPYIYDDMVELNGESYEALLEAAELYHDRAQEEIE